MLRVTMPMSRTVETVLLMIALLFIFVIASTGCGGFHIPNPFPTPTPTTTPPPPPGPVCPLPGQGLDPSTWCGCWENSGRTDGEWKYMGDCPPPVPHDPVCEPDTNCDCWVQPPGEGWKELTCGAGQECVEHVCREIPPPPPPPVVCPVTDQQALKLCSEKCADPKYTGCKVSCDDLPAGAAPVVTCIEPPPPPPGSCPPIVGQLYINDKPAGHGFDSSPRVRGDENFCFLVTGEHGWKDCSFEGLKNRAECEIMAMGGCPVWQYITEPTSKITYQCHDDQSAPASCDHFGSPSAQDDPKTPDVFEGLPSACGIQRDAYGPNAGFFTVAHGGTPGCLTPEQSSYRIRACFPNNLGICGPWRPFCH